MTITIASFLPTATKRLAAAGVGTARLDCLVLLEDALGKDRSYLLAHPELALGPTLRKLELQIERRAKHEPLAYIRGKTEFYGREFLISKHVLEPRPESETMIVLLKTKLRKDEPCAVVDVGTGSGALAITARLELPDCKVIATDIDPKCLKVAKKNAEKHQAKVKFLEGDLLQPIIAHCSMLTALLCNLPYVPDDYHVNEAAGAEPRLAIFGGRDGLDLCRKLFWQIAKISQKPRYVLTESLPFQHQELTKIAANSGYRLETTDDFIQLFTHM